MSTYISLGWRMQIRKKWRNQLENFFFTNIFEKIIWHLFAGESHQVVKITVTKCVHSTCGQDGLVL